MSGLCPHEGQQNSSWVLGSSAKKSGFHLSQLPGIPGYGQALQHVIPGSCGGGGSSVTPTQLPSGRRAPRYPPHCCTPHPLAGPQWQGYCSVPPSGRHLLDGGKDHVPWVLALPPRAWARPLESGRREQPPSSIQSKVVPTHTFRTLLFSCPRCNFQVVTHLRR